MHSFCELSIVRIARLENYRFADVSRNSYPSSVPEHARSDKLPESVINVKSKLGITRAGLAQLVERLTSNYT